MMRTAGREEVDFPYLRIAGILRLRSRKHKGPKDRGAARLNRVKTGKRAADPEERSEPAGLEGDALRAGQQQVRSPAISPGTFPKELRRSGAFPNFRKQRMSRMNPGE